MKNTKVTIPDNVDMHVIGAPDFLTNPMSLMEQWMLCDENGYLEGNVLFDERTGHGRRGNITRLYV